MYDYIVVGAGVIGSSAAYALAKQGKKTLLIEQFPLPHIRGSSHGGSRITRQAYPESFNGRIMTVANPMWKILEEESGMTLFKSTGLLCTTTVEHEELSNYRETIEKYSKKHVPLLSSQEMTEMYPLISYPPEETGCFDDSAGILYADKCLRAFQRVFEGKGGVIVDHCKVRSITPGDTVTVHTDKGDFQSKGLVLACGGWASRILGDLGVVLPLKTEALQVCYWKSKPGVDHSKLPAFIACDKVSDIYGLPTSEYDGLVKICLHYGVPCHEPDMRDRADKESEERNMAILKRFVASRFPHLIPEPAIKERCMYTCTPDHQFVVDTHPIYKNIAFGAGFSGHGFKMAPVIGTMLADLVQSRKPELLVKELRANRFNKKSKL